MKKFKSKRKSNMLFIYIGLFLISMAFTIRYLYKEKLINNDTIINYLINDNFGAYRNDFQDVDFILKYALNIDLKGNNVPVIKPEPDNLAEKLEENTKEDEKRELEKIVYIYNTHQEEKYKNTYLEVYNITPTVFMASKILKEYLEELGIGVIVEEENVTTKLRSLNLSYSGSYKVTRIFMEKAKEKTPSLKYFIDLHRDSSNYDKTTAVIDNESYAKILFLVGLENPSYEKNLELAEKLKSKVVNYNSSLSRGILKKSGAGVNGIYNQDFSDRAMLIEVGGQYNNISEVNNSLKVLANILAEYIKEDLNE